MGRSNNNISNTRSAEPRAFTFVSMEYVAIISSCSIHEHIRICFPIRYVSYHLHKYPIQEHIHVTLYPGKRTIGNHQIMGLSWTNKTVLYYGLTWRYGKRQRLKMAQLSV